MNSRVHILILLCIAALAGCSGPRQYRYAIESLQAEYRALETDYNMLQYDFEKQQAELERIQGREDGLGEHDPLSMNAGVQNGAPYSTLERDGMPSEIHADISNPSQSLTPEEFVSLFEGERVADGDQNPSSNSPQGRSILGSVQDRNVGASNTESYRFNHSTASAPIHPVNSTIDNFVSHLIIDPVRTTGVDLDGRPGDDGFTVVLETRNADDFFVAESGQIEISLIDPAELGESQRIGMWQFSKAEVETLLNNVAGQGRGVQVTLEWPNRTPNHRRLMLFARWTGSEGDRLETSAELLISLEGDARHGWSARMTPRSQPPSNGTPTYLAEDPSRASQNRGGQTDETTPDDSSVPQWRPYR